MTEQADIDIASRIKQKLVASLRAMNEGNEALSDMYWREYIGLVELSMGRTGSVERLTPDPKAADKLP